MRKFVLSAFFLAGAVVLCLPINGIAPVLHQKAQAAPIGTTLPALVMSLPELISQDPFDASQSAEEVAIVTSKKFNQACPCCKNCPCTICKGSAVAGKKKQYRQVCENGVCKMVPVDHSPMPVGPVMQQPTYQPAAAPSGGGRFQVNGPVRKVFQRVFHRRR